MEQRQRILLVHNYYKIPGGEDTVVENEKRLLEQEGHFVYLYSRSNKEIDTFSVFKKFLLPFTSLFSIHTYLEIKHLILKENIDIVHVHNTLSLISPSVYYAAFACKKPVVQTMHNFRLLCPAAIFLRDGRICEDCVDKGLRCAVRYGCYRNSRIQSLVSVGILKLHRFLGVYRNLFYICLTDFNKNKLLCLNRNGKSYIREDRIFVKPNFVQMPQIETEQKKEQYVYIGRLEKLKGIHVLLEAWRAFPEKRLFVCGNGPEKEWASSYVKKHNLTGVTLLGQCSHEKILQILAESKALILPTMCYEGQPMVILESYAAGTPVIVSDIGNAGNMVEIGITGLKFSCGDAVSLQEAVKQMEAEVKEWDTKSTYQKLYTEKKNYELLQQIYTKIQIERGSI